MNDRIDEATPTFDGQQSLSGHGVVEETLERRRDRYRTLFDNDELVLWEQDFSTAVPYAESLADGTDDLQRYLVQHPEELLELFERVDVHNVNGAALEFYGADSQEDLVSNLEKTITEDAIEGLAEMWQRVVEGERYFCKECHANTLDGSGTKVELMEMYVPESHADDYSLVFTTGTDITDRKRRQHALEASHDARSALQRTLADATSVEAFAEAVRAALTAVEDVLTVRLARVTREESIEPLAQDGEDAAPEAATDLAVAAVREDERQRAELDDGRVRVTVPARYGGVTRGVLVATLAESPTLGWEHLRSLLAESADVLGYAIGNERRRRTLASENMTELTITIETADRPLPRAAAAVGVPASVTAAIPRGEDEILCYLEVPDAQSSFAAAARETAGIEHVEVIEAGDTARLQVRVTGPVPSAVVADHGGDVVEATVDAETTTVAVRFPGGRSFDPVLGALEAQFGSVRVNQYTTAPSDDRGASGPLADLTDRQREVLEAAVQAGYFEEPRGQSMTELADQLGVSRQSCAEVLRAAERNLFSELIER